MFVMLGWLMVFCRLVVDSWLITLAWVVELCVVVIVISLSWGCMTSGAF